MITAVDGLNSYFADYFAHSINSNGYLKYPVLCVVAAPAGP